MSGAMRTQRGIGLIEILVTVVILSVGFLAAARMQVEGMRFSQSAYHQSQAYFMASDMIDRMRANADGVDLGVYDGLETASNLPERDCAAAPCDANALAAHDLFEWSAYVHQAAPVLPSSENVQANGRIIALGNDRFSIVIRWSELIGGEDTAETLTLNFAI